MTSTELYMTTQETDNTCLILQRSSIAFPHRKVTDVTLFCWNVRDKNFHRCNYQTTLVNLVNINSIMALMHLYYINQCLISLTCKCKFVVPALPQCLWSCPHEQIHLKRWCLSHSWWWCFWFCSCPHLQIPRRSLWSRLSGFQSWRDDWTFLCLPHWSDPSDRSPGTDPIITHRHVRLIHNKQWDPCCWF